MLARTEHTHERSDGWYSKHVETNEIIGPYKTQNDAFLASMLYSSVEKLVRDMVETGLVTDESFKVLKPSDFSNWKKRKP